MNPLDYNRRHITRRALLGRTATGIGIAAALAELMGNDLAGIPSADADDAAGWGDGGIARLAAFCAKGQARRLHVPERRRSSHVDLFDLQTRN